MAAGLLLGVGAGFAQTWNIGSPTASAVTATLTLSDSTLTISGTGTMANYSTSNYAPWYSSYRNRIKSIVIDNGVTTIGSYAFSGCSKIASVTIPELITSVGNFAFQGCTSLQTVNFNATNCTTMGSSSTPVFSGCTAFTTLNIGSSITRIPNYAFSGCNKLTSISIPNGITSIGQSAFAGCRGLDTVTVQWAKPLYVSNVFSDVNCSNITLKVPTGTASLYRSANVWKEFNIPIEQSELPCTNPSTYGTSNSLVWAICDNTLKINGSGVIPDFSSNNSPWYAYRSSIHNIEIGSNVTTIGSYAFSGCTNLESITIPSTVNSIGNYAFNGCTGLSSITFQTKWMPDIEQGMTIGIKSIENNTFSGCTSLASIIIPKTVTTLSTTTFNGSSLTAINVDADNPNYASADGVLLNKANTTLIRYPIKKTVNLNSIPESVTTIGNYAFDGCTELTDITIPNHIKNINGYAFINCNLTSITIPNTVTSIGNYTFDGCMKLESITLPLNLIKDRNFFGQLFHSYQVITTGNSNVNYPLSEYKQNGQTAKSCSYCTEDSKSGFQHDLYYVPVSLKTLNITDDADIKSNFFQNTNLEIVSIPLVKSIGDNAFNGCSLTSITIPNSVTTIGSNAFANCPLQEVTTPIVQTGLGLFPTSLQKLTVTDACANIPAGVLSTCSNLKELTLPFIGTSPTAPTTLSAVFSGSVPVSLKKLTLVRSSAEIKIADNALLGLSQLAELTLSSNVQEVGRNALDGCSGLRDIYSHWAYPPVAYNNSTFEGVHKQACVIHVPIGSKNWYAEAAGWKEFYNIQEEAAVSIIVHPVPLYGGIIEGGTLHKYNYDANASLTASGNMGYDFQAWMENDKIVSTNRTYNFTVEGARTLYAVFTPRENENAVSVSSPTPNEALISWDGEVGASTYTLIVYSDAARTQEYARFEFNADGSVRQAKGISISASHFSQTIGNLIAGQRYYYSVTAYDSENYKLSIAIGNFDAGNTGVVETRHATSLQVAGYYSILGQKLPKEPESGLYIILYDNGKAEKVLK